MKFHCLYNDLMHFLNLHILCHSIPLILFIRFASAYSPTFVFMCKCPPGSHSDKRLRCSLLIFWLLIISHTLDQQFLHFLILLLYLHLEFSNMLAICNDHHFSSVFFSFFFLVMVALFPSFEFQLVDISLSANS